jgi:hypothetical protein
VLETPASPAARSFLFLSFVRSTTRLRPAARSLRDDIVHAQAPVRVIGLHRQLGLEILLELHEVIGQRHAVGLELIQLEAQLLVELLPRDCVRSRLLEPESPDQHIHAAFRHATQSFQVFVDPSCLMERGACPEEHSDGSSWEILLQEYFGGRSMPGAGAVHLIKS